MPPKARQKVTLKGKHKANGASESSGEDTKRDIRKQRVVVTPRTLQPIRSLLPIEILLHIISYLPQASLRAWTTVCKDLGEEASKLLFHDLRIDLKKPQRIFDRLIWFTDRRNIKRTAEVRRFAIVGETNTSSYLFNPYLEPIWSYPSQDDEYVAFKARQAGELAEIAPERNPVMDTEKVILEYMPNVRYLELNLGLREYGLSPFYVLPSHKFPHLKTFLWNASNYSGSWNDLVRLLKGFVDTHEDLALHVNLAALSAYRYQPRGTIQPNNIPHDDPDDDPDGMALRYTHFDKFAFTTLVRTANKHGLESNSPVAAALVGSINSLVNLGVYCQDDSTEALPLQRYPRLKCLVFNSPIIATPMEDETPLDPNLQIENLPYHSIFESFFSLNNNLSAIALDIHESALQRYIALGDFLVGTEPAVAAYPVQIEFLPNLQHLHLPLSHSVRANPLSTISKLLRLHGHNLVSFQAPVDFTRETLVERGWGSEEDLLRHVAVLPRLEYLSLATIRRYINYRGNYTVAQFCPFASPIQRHTARSDPYTITDVEGDPQSTYNVLANKSRTIKYMFSLTMMMDNCGWLVTRRTRLPSRKEGFFHKDGKRKAIGDFLKVKTLKKSETLSVVEDVMGSYIGQGFRLEGFREKMSAVAPP